MLLGLGSRETAAAPAIALRPLRKDPPRALRILRVPESYLTVAAALADARPGDHVTLRAGVYDADQVWVGPNVGAADRHVVVRARTRHQAVLTGRVTIATPGIWLHGLRTKFVSASDGTVNDEYSVRIQASRTYLTRCRFESLGAVRIYAGVPEYRDIVIAYNDFVTSDPYRYRDSQLYIGDVVAASAGPTELDIAYNRFVDTAPHRLNLPNGDPAPRNERFVIHMGNSKPGDNPTGVNLSIRIHHNVISGHRPHAIYIKRHVYIGFNYVVTEDRATDFPQLGFRHGGGSFGQGGIIEGNYANGNGVNVNDTGARVLGNNLPNGAVRLHCGVGTWDPAVGKYVNLYQAASDCVLAGNVARYRVGYTLPPPEGRLLLDSQGRRVRNIRIHMAARGVAGDVRLEPSLPVATVEHTAGSLDTPYEASSILIDPHTDGGYTFPQAVGAELLKRVGADAP